MHSAPGGGGPWTAATDGNSFAVPNVTEAFAPATQQEYPTAALALAAAPPAKRSDRRRLWTLIGVMGFIAACGVAVLAFFGFNGGWTALVIGVGSAVIPVPVLVFCFLWLDRYEPEPVKYLIFVFGWGACVATGVHGPEDEGGSTSFARTAADSDGRFALYTEESEPSEVTVCTCASGCADVSFEYAGEDVAATLYYAPKGKKPED